VGYFGVLKRYNQLWNWQLNKNFEDTLLKHFVPLDLVFGELCTTMRIMLSKEPCGFLKIRGDPAHLVRTHQTLTKAFPHESHGVLTKSRRGQVVRYLMIDTNLPLFSPNSPLIHPLRCVSRTLSQGAIFF